MPLHPSLVHLPLGLAVLMPFLAAGFGWAVWTGRVRLRAWAAVVALQAALVVGGLVALQSGKAEEERVESVVTDAAIETHEEAAELFLWAAGLTLVVAAGAFVIYNIQVVLLKQLNAFFENLPVHIPVLSDLNFVEYQFLLYGVALVLMMLFRPEGLFPSRQRKRELHATEELGEEDAAGEIVGGMGSVPGNDEIAGEAR